MPLNQYIESVAKQITVKSAVNPSLWACAVISLPSFIICSYETGWKSIGFFIIGIIPVSAFLISYLYLLFKSPNFLRSEEYQLRAEALNYFGNKDKPFDVDAEDVIRVVTNPGKPEGINPQSNNMEQLPEPKNL